MHPTPIVTWEIGSKCSSLKWSKMQQIAIIYKGINNNIIDSKWANKHILYLVLKSIEKDKYDGLWAFF